MKYPRKKLGEIFRLRGGKRLPVGEQLLKTPTIHPYIRGRDIRNGRVFLDEPVYVSDELFGRLKNYVVETNDVCITIVGNIGDVGLVPPQLNGANLTENAVRLTEPANDCDPIYAMYALLSDGPQSQMKLSAAGAAQSKLGLYKVQEIEIPYPPPLTQRRIAAILSAYDDLIENNNRRIRILEEMAQLLYREWFVHFRFPGHEGVKMVKGVPEGWSGRLDDALILQRGFDLPTKQRREGNVPVYAATGVVGAHNEVKVKGPSVVTGRSGSLGTVLYIHEDFWPLNTALWIKEFRRVTPIYAFYLLSSLDLTSFNSGAAVPTLNRNDIHGLPVVIPDRTVLEQFDTHVQPMFEMKRCLELKNANLRRTRDLLLPRLVSGEVDVERLEIGT